MSRKPTAGDDRNPGKAFETVPPDEANEISETAALGRELQDMRAMADETQNGKRLRGVHPKSHGCVRAKFTVRRDLEEEFRVGLFARPGRSFRAWVRFSNASVLREDDLKANDEGVRENGSRGMAIKVMNVGGDVLETDDGRNNQDFLMINTPEFAFGNVRDYLRLNRILTRTPKGDVARPYFFPAVLAQLGEPTDGEPPETTGLRQQLQGAVANDPLLNNLTEADLRGTFASAGVVQKIQAQVVRHPMQVQYFGAAPFLFGPGRVMKFSAAPSVPVEQKPFDAVTADEPSPDYLREALTRTMSGEKDVSYDFMVQVRDRNAPGLNIEDATTTWPDEESRYVTVARLTIPAPQSPQSTRAQRRCEKFAFNPWHALVEHQPLGGINRLRRKVYLESADHRDAGVGPERPTRRGLARRAETIKKLRTEHSKRAKTGRD